MKINELILENSVDEGIGQAIGKTWGGLAKGVGATVGGLAGTWEAAKQGYAAGKSAVTGKNADGTPVTTAPAPTGSTPPAQDGAPAAEPAAPAAPVGMKADEIVKGLSDVWGKARASQDSKTGAPAVQQQIRAMGKEAGMAGQTFENKKSTRPVVEFRSNFLGMQI